jgi:hypothetical protein
MHDDYKPVDMSQFAFAPPNGGPTLAPCPVCGSAASLWQYSTSETAPRKLLVCCTNGEPIGPQDGLVGEGCLLYLPPNNFYRETIRDAVRYWNEFAKALTALRASHEAGVPGTFNDQRQVRKDTQGLGEPGRLSPLDAALAAPGCERLRDFYAVGPVQRAAVESFADALAADVAMLDKSSGNVVRVDLSSTGTAGVMVGPIMRAISDKEIEQIAGRDELTGDAILDFGRRLLEAAANPPNAGVGVGGGGQPKGGA